MLIRSSRLAIMAFGVVIAGSPAFAAVIPVFNTGVGANHQVLANGAPEQHYTLSGWGTPRVATSANGYPVGPWIGDDTLSAWIGPNTDAQLDTSPGQFDYQTTFTLAANQVSTAAIIGRWSTDNYGFDILINGQSTGNVAWDYTNWYNFSVTSGFVTGVNTLDFIIYNAGGPTGLRVEMTGSAAPEPVSWALMLGGFGAIGGALRARRKAAVSFG